MLDLTSYRRKQKHAKPLTVMRELYHAYSTAAKNRTYSLGEPDPLARQTISVDRFNQCYTKLLARQQQKYDSLQTTQTMQTRSHSKLPKTLLRRAQQQDDVREQPGYFRSAFSSTVNLLAPHPSIQALKQSNTISLLSTLRPKQSLINKLFDKKEPAIRNPSKLITEVLKDKKTQDQIQEDKQKKLKAMRLEWIINTKYNRRPILDAGFDRLSRRPNRIFSRRPESLAQIFPCYIFAVVNDFIADQQQLQQNKHTFPDMEVNIPINLSPRVQNQLKNHAYEISRKEEESIKSKLEKEWEKDNKIREIEDKFVKWAQRKNENIKEKLAKGEKIKEDHIAKIIKRCKNRDKFLEKKHQDCLTSKRKSMNLAWKKAQKFKEDIQTYYKSRHQLGRAAKALSSAADIHSHQLYNSLDKDTLDRPQRHTQKSQQLANNSAKQLNNKIHVSFNAKEKNFFYTSNYETYSSHSKSIQHGQENREKSAEILEKFKFRTQHEEQLKIQQLGEKLQKIEQTRIRKMKKAQKKSDAKPRSRNKTTADFMSRKKQQQRANLSQTQEQDRMLTGDSHRKQSKIKERINEAKQKREQMFEQHLAEGEQYLENIKIRHLKNVIAKNIAYSAMEKKLYIERLHH